MFNKVKTIDQVINQFTKVINDLQEIVEYKELKVAHCTDEIERLTWESEEHVRERDKAKKISDKLQKLLGD
jgi:hypothetical protein